MIRNIFILLLLPFVVISQENVEPTDTSVTTTPVILTYFSSEAFTEKYELLLKYNPITPGKEATLQLFVSEYQTNKPLDSVNLEVTVMETADIGVDVSKIEKGIYDLKATFPEKSVYNLIVNINSHLGPDLILLNNIETGKELPIAEVGLADTSPWYTSNWFFGLMGLFIGILVMIFIHKSISRKITTATILLLCLLPTATYNPVSAHGGEDHGDGGDDSGASFISFLVEKETQFLFNILTQETQTGDFKESTVLLGTVIASPQGRAVIQSPQTGKIVSLKVIPGQKVGRGQVMAVIEQQIDAGTQINIISQANSVNAEYEAAKAQYERLKAIEDIAAKKDITEAKARYESAKNNKALFESNTGGSGGGSKLITLTSPVRGNVSTFNYAIGAVVSAGETLFEVINLDQVFVEAQVFKTDVVKLEMASGYTTTSITDMSTYRLKLVSTGQTVNVENQSQKVLLEIINPKGQFRLGENVNIRMTGNDLVKQTFLPNEAITDVNGKPAVFIKDKAEQYSVSYIIIGQSNDKFTQVIRGVEEGERVVSANVYQMKMIYLNQ